MPENLPQAAVSDRKILVYGVSRSTNEGRLFHEVAAEYGSRIRVIREDELDRSLIELYQDSDDDPFSSLDGGSTATDSTAVQESGSPDRGYVVICGFDRPGLDELLRSWHSSKVAGLALKAVATPNNLNWPLGELFRELEREDEVTKAYVALRKDVRRLEKLLENQGLSADPETLCNHVKPEAAASLSEARRLLKDIQAIEDPRDLHEAHAKLRESWSLTQ